jgi:aminoglycoside 3-N-acetyltransferase
MSSVTHAGLLAAWRAAGLAPGDTVLLHASAKRTLAAMPNGDARALLDTFLETVGADGTLLLPLFNFGFANGAPFDIRTAPSHMGAVSEAGRRHPDAVRTGHPIYSFAAIGARAHEFAGVNNRSGYGADSPFAMLRAMDGKIAVLDLDDQRSMTFYHHVEEMRRVPYRHFKTFTGAYTNADGETSIEGYDIYVRDLNRGVCTDVNRCGALMWRAGLYTGEAPHIGAGLRVVHAREMFDFVSGVIAAGRAYGLLYSLAPEKRRA